METMQEVLDWFRMQGPWNAETRSYDPLPDPVLDREYEVIAAEYVDEDYSGDVFVLLKSGDEYYEINGGHCSCYGLEDQWDPQLTTEEALRHRVEKGSSYGAFHDCIPDMKNHFGW
jgi:hypothetical protein